MKVTKLVTSILLLFLFSFVYFPGAKSGSIDEEIKKATEAKKILEEQLKADKAQKEAINRQQSQAETELEQIELSMTKLQSQIDQLAAKIQQSKVEYLDLNQEIDSLKVSIEEKNNRMKALLKVLYQNYTMSFNAYLFTSNSINEIIDKAVYVQYLFEADKAFFRSLKEEKQLLETKKQHQVEIENKLQSDKAELDKENTRYKELEDQKSQKVVALSMQKSQVDVSISKGAQALDEADREIKKLLQRKKEEELKRKLLSTTFGTIIWPINGPVSSPFGMRMHPIFRVYRLHTGVDIDAVSGTPIKSITKGIVIYAGWLSGYGNTVVILHTAQYSSLYAHMRTIYVKENQEVSLGTAIGEVGTTGWSTEPHLHFEIRLDEEPIDPMKFLSPS